MLIWLPCGDAWLLTLLLVVMLLLQGEALSVLHGMCLVGSLVSGTSALHVAPTAPR